MKSQKRHHWFVKAQQDLSILTLFRGLKLSVTFDELIRTKFKKNSKYVSEPAEKIISSAPINIGPQIILTSLLILSDVVTEQTPSVCWKNNMSITAVTCYESEGQGVPNTLLNLSGNTAIYNAQIFRSFFADFLASLARYSATLLMIVKFKTISQFFNFW